MQPTRDDTVSPLSAPVPATAASRPDSGEPLGAHARRKGSFWSIFWVLLGPGLIAMIGDNDAGGVLSYAATGATFGAGFFSLIVLGLIPVTYTVQELTMRLGSVSQRPFPALVLERFGKAWGSFSLIALLLENILTLVTEFIGMSIGLAVLGVPFVAADLGSVCLVVLFALVGRYWSKERLALFVGALNIVFVVIAVLTKPTWHAVWGSFHEIATLGASFGLLYFVIATVGNAVAPWMIFFQGSAVIDKGMTHHDLHYGRLDTALGSVVQSLLAVGIVVCGAALHTLVATHPALLSAPASLLQGYLIHNGVWVRDLFALGLINAGFLAAITISLSTSWTFAGVFGWAKSLNDTPRQAPKFYALYVGGLVLAAGIVLIPGLPLTQLAVLTQVIAALLIVPLLIFLARLTSDPQLMGRYANGRWTKVRVWGVVCLISALSLALLWQWISG